MSKTKKTLQQKGFTIVELMIATAVVSTVLVLATSVILSINSIYYKGFNLARTQDDTRNILDQMSQDIQLSDSAPQTSQSANDISITLHDGPPETKTAIEAICVGNSRYTFVLNAQIGSNPISGSPPQIAHVLWHDRIAVANGPCLPLDLTKSDPEASAGAKAGTNGNELMAPRARLTAFGFCSPVKPDVICPSGVSNAFNFYVGVAYGDPSLSPPPKNLCTGGSSDQFCATDTLQTFILRRV